MIHMKVKFGLEGPNYPWEAISEIAVFSEQVGLDSYWMPDHTVATGVKRWDAIEAWGALNALAIKTKIIRLASGVSDTYRIHPAVLAQKATTLDIISGGRAVLGIGIGEAMNLVPYGIPYDKPVTRTEEALIVIKRLWTEEFVDFQGTYYKLNRAFLQPKPIQQPHVPIYVAASSPRTMELAGKYGDGWLPANLTVQLYEEGVKAVKEAAKKVGRDPDKIDIAHFMYGVIAKDRDEAKKSAMLPTKLLVLTRPRILEAVGYTPPTYDFEMTYKLVFPMDAEAWLTKAKELPDEIIYSRIFDNKDAPIIAGVAEDFIERFERYIKVGCKHFIMNFQVPPKVLKEAVQLFAEKVLTYFKELKV